MKTVSLEESKTIFRKLVQLQDSDTKTTTEIRRYLQDTVITFNEAVQEVVGIEFKIDPEVFLDSINDLHYLGGALLGLAVGVFRRAKYHEQAALIPKAEEKRVGPTASERDQLMRGSVADLEGLVTALEQVLTNLSNRIGGFRSVIRKNFER